MISLGQLKTTQFYHLIAVSQNVKLGRRGLFQLSHEIIFKFLNYIFACFAKIYPIPQEFGSVMIKLQLKPLLISSSILKFCFTYLKILMPKFAKILLTKLS